MTSSSTDLTKSFQLTPDLHVAPIRNLDDFLLGNARFQVPPYNDLNKWSHRITSNLLYYQTNYFAIIMAVFFLVSLLHPRDMLLGFACICLAFAVFAYATSANNDAVTFKKEHPLISLAVILCAGYFLVYMIGSVIVFFFSMALPMLLVFVHASFRLRTMANKLANKIEAVGFTKTIMGRILDVLGLKVELINFD